MKRIKLNAGVVFLTCIITVCANAQTQKLPVSGKKIYDDNCLTCHQESGMGVPGMNPPLSQTTWVTGDKNQLITIVLKGLKKPLEINDEVYHNPMPAHAFLTDKEIAAVLTYIRSNFGNASSAVTELEVKKVRDLK